MKRIKLEELPDRARIKGMAPIGIPWMATWNKTLQKMVPDGDCPAEEFAALTFDGMVLDIPANENFFPYEHQQ